MNWEPRYEHTKQLQELQNDVVPLSPTYLKPHWRFFIPNYYLYHKQRFPLMKGGSDRAVTEAIPHKHVDLPHLLTAEDICVRPAAVKYPRRA